MERKTTTLQELTARLAKFDADARAREGEQPTHAPAPTKPIEKMSIEEMRAESARLNAANPATAAMRSKRQAARQHVKSEAQRRVDETKAWQYAEAAVEGYNDRESWQYDPDTGEEQNLVWESNIRKMLELEEAAAPAIARLFEDGFEEQIGEVAVLMVQLEEAQSHAELAAEGQNFVKEIQATGKKVTARVEQLIAQNDFVNPKVFLDEAARLREQLTTGGATGPDRQRIGEMADKKMEEAARAQERRDDWLARFRRVAETMPAGTFLDYDLAHTALNDSLNMTAALANAEEDAEIATKSLRARADAEGIGADSRDKDGKLVVQSVYGGDALYLSDDAAAGLLAAGTHRLIRDDIPVTMPDMEDALNPQPTVAELIQDIADRENAAAATADQEALDAQIRWASQGPSAEERAAADAEREAANKASRLAELNSLAEDA